LTLDDLEGKNCIGYSSSSIATATPLTRIQWECGCGVQRS